MSLGKDSAGSEEVYFEKKIYITLKETHGQHRSPEKQVQIRSEMVSLASYVAHESLIF